MCEASCTSCGVKLQFNMPKEPSTIQCYNCKTLMVVRPDGSSCAEVPLCAADSCTCTSCGARLQFSTPTQPTTIKCYNCEKCMIVNPAGSNPEADAWRKADAAMAALLAEEEEDKERKASKKGKKKKKGKKVPNGPALLRPLQASTAAPEPTEVHMPGYDPPSQRTAQAAEQEAERVRAAEAAHQEEARRAELRRQEEADAAFARELQAGQERMVRDERRKTPSESEGWATATKGSKQKHEFYRGGFVFVCDNNT